MFFFICTPKYPFIRKFYNILYILSGSSFWNILNFCCDYNEDLILLVCILRICKMQRSKPSPLSSNCIKKRYSVCFQSHRLLPRCCGCHSLHVSPLSSLSLLDINRHQVCTGGFWEAVQTNYWPGFLFKENKPSRWDTLVIFWEGSLIQGIGIDMCGAQKLNDNKDNKMQITSVVYPRFYWG